MTPVPIQPTRVVSGETGLTFVMPRMYSRASSRRAAVGASPVVGTLLERFDRRIVERQFSSQSIGIPAEQR